MKALHMVSFLLVVVGALNWGLVGFFQYNLVESLLGASGLTTVVYSLVGVAAVVEVVTHKANCKLCGGK
ncbi:hypothetical protein A3G67_02175 [Candidatus Roizmanbacteria bacterium RIFCSPLOWO2_12_FULL_40_12]|uniref:DUF378 domain-containing protein n=1 Tax=Candidatus Roizmanbacteria bacterium RIFCSPLOWO2_01_FULL_40_42 TaxID=1802066 RepID=A0A1F7J3Q3_9BACT|nr:MAG: hypothetical protein A2779_01380 [Candidatus Roizmanbacteria bacterium RIFCSPHIGHO2_01_FULL_40_98]OGK29011.1 MAG: hypothetical protein A3C31_02020 [Candidatus Roizmanbacteria bacterium RIFCSPHIGHO2_02_FULL_40_53]OGK29992.1 MAG: hypothetical protein A2W49_00190 [Candidatus Roizmanbacteria bacterium RIFCSPHIGHO2_12_41_18]OGK37299.1 MAG: hypothetical protein A3E69_04320 [Candidatus Roizmanbacteria bacterium RIFCSPHIGHO2_12_FULL_40_130]OGK50241.1 MAG: hypothetical protein A3B50_00475 [Candi